jgi:predicted esterase
MLTGLPWLVDLGDGGKLGDVVTLPLGATEPRPLIVAVHGAGDRPEWACGGWRFAVESYAFVLCPRGLPMGPTKYGWGSARDIDAAIERALTAFRGRFAHYLTKGPMIYAGFSQGTTLVGKYLVDNADRFPIAVLAEGGYDYLTDGSFARKYRAAGGQRVLLLCGTPSCQVTYGRAQRGLEREGLNVEYAGDPRSGHNLNPRMQNALRGVWPKLVAGLGGWQSFADHRWPATAR